MLREWSDRPKPNPAGDRRDQRVMLAAVILLGSLLLVGLVLAVWSLRALG